MTPEEIRVAAEAEVFAEDYRAKVEREKERIRYKRRRFPWRVAILKNEPPTPRAELSQILWAHGWELLPMSDFTDRGLLHYATVKIRERK